jgi:hypothetical protein
MVNTPIENAPELLPNADFAVQNEGSIFILYALSAAAKEWADEHIGHAQRWGVNGYVIEHRYVLDIVDGIQNDGLTFEK